MIAATIQDPRLFSEEAVLDGCYKALLLDHLAHVAHSHMIVVDEDGVIGRALISAIASLPVGVRKRAEAAVSTNRVIRLAPDAVRRQQYESTGIDVGTAITLALNQLSIDAVISDEDGKVCAALIDGDPPARVFTLPEYLSSPTHDRLLCTMGAVSTGGMARVDFGASIVGPVLRWAKSPRVIDRYITTALYENNPSDDPNLDNQWNRVRETIRYMYDVWNRTSVVNKDFFKIVTKPYLKGWGNRPWHYGACPSLEQQAERLANELDLGKFARIEFIKVPRELWDIEHDRYLVTDNEFILSFSRGFDLIRPGGILLESSVSLYHPGSQSFVLSMLLRAEVLATCSLIESVWATEVKRGKYR